MKTIEVWSDGSATTGKPGGYGWVLIVDDVFHSEGSGYSENATNNDMELLGAIEGLVAAKAIVSPLVLPKITLVSDSQIVLGWASGAYRFKQEDKRDKYDQLSSLMRSLNANTRWIKGHAGHVWNERCDKLANKARLGIKEDLDTPTNLVETKIGTKKTGVVSLWYLGQLKIIDFEQQIVENYNREAHGKRGSVVEIRENKDR